jgi:hypothetical protein
MVALIAWCVNQCQSKRTTRPIGLGKVSWPDLAGDWKYYLFKTFAGHASSDCTSCLKRVEWGRTLG